MKAFVCLIFGFLFSGVCVFAQTGQTGGTAAPITAMQYFRMGRNLEAGNRMAEADAYYNEAVRICQSEVSGNTATRDTYTAITWTLQRQRKYGDVITWGERGLRIFSDEYRILETMGEAYFYLDDYDRSLSFMQRYANALPRGERISVAYFFIGEIYRLREKYRHADIAYTTAVLLEPGLPLWWFRLAQVRELLGDRTEATAAYEQAIRINPNYQEAIAGLARTRPRQAPSGPPPIP
jgi:tetratricopeptide (TPR) repeat protein